MGMSKQTNDIVDSFADKASSTDEQKVLDDVSSKVQELHSSKSTAIKELLQHVKLAFYMLNDKNYNLSWKSKTLLIGALLYFLLPTDLTPDFLPIIGYIDDAAVISAVFKRLANEVKSYESYLNQ